MNKPGPRIDSEALTDLKQRFGMNSITGRWLRRGTVVYTVDEEPLFGAILLDPSKTTPENFQEMLVQRCKLLDGVIVMQFRMAGLLTEIDFARRAMDAFVTMNAYAAKVKAAGASEEDRKMALDIFMAAEKSLSKTIEEYKCWAAELPCTAEAAAAATSQPQPAPAQVRPVGK